MDLVRVLASSGITHTLVRVRDGGAHWLCQKQVEALLVQEGLTSGTRFKDNCKKYKEQTRKAKSRERMFCVQSGAVANKSAQVLMIQLSALTQMLSKQYKDKELEAMFQSTAELRGQKFFIHKKGMP